jgi:hypothetical protein
MNDPIRWPLIDLVVLAGSPEFLHGPLAPLYKGLAENPQIPLLALGVGYSIPMENLTLGGEEHAVLSRASTLIITRQYDLKYRLGELLAGKPVYTLPCPALFAPGGRCAPPGRPRCAIRQAPTGRQPINEADYQLTEEHLADEEYDIITHYIDDYAHFKKGFYSSDPQRLLQEIGQYQKVVSNRLHGGIVALGHDAEVEFINGDNRVQKTLQPLENYKNCDGYYKVGAPGRRLLRDQYNDLIRKFTI